MPSVSDPRHANLEYNVNRHMTDCGGVTFAIPYHDVVDKSVRDMLSANESVSAHLVRTRADRHTIFESGLVVKWDAKTTNWKTGDNFCIEALPYLAACIESTNFGIDYLFCCERRDRSNYGIIAGSDAISRVRRIVIPTWRHTDDYETWAEMFRGIFKRYGVDIEIMPSPGARGSGDPLVAVQVDDGQLLGWQETINSILERNPECQHSVSGGTKTATSV